MVLDRMPETMEEAKDYAAKTVDIPLVEKMEQLSPVQYQSILRPDFKDDEMPMIMVGATLGFLVGERQELLVDNFAHVVR